MVMLNYLQAFSPIIGLMVNMISHIYIRRYMGNIGFLKSLVVSFALGFSVLAVALPSIFIAAITYSALSYCYFHFVNLGETARRIRILRELYDSENGLSKEDILKRYNDREIIGRRIDRLLNNGQIIFRNQRYYIGKPFMLLAAKVLAAVKVIILGL